METIRLFFLFLKKSFRSGKIRHLSVILLYSFLYLFIFIMLSSTFTIKKTSLKTYETNLSSENINMVYNSGLNNVTSSNYLKLKECIKSIDEQIANIYASNRYFELYDFDYLDIPIINGSLSSKNTNENGVFLSIDFEDEYNIGDYYYVNELSFLIIGFFDGEDTAIANLEYVISLNQFSIRNVSFAVNYKNMNKDNINQLLKVYEDMNEMVEEPESFSSIELETVINVNKITNIYMILSVIIMIILSIFSILSIINVYDINSKIDNSFYSIMRISGLSKKKLFKFVVLQDILLNIISIFCSISLYYISLNALKAFLTNLISIIFELFVDDFYFNVSFSHYNSVLIFLIPFLLNVSIIIVRTLIASHFKKDNDYLGGLNDYSR